MKQKMKQQQKSTKKEEQIEVFVSEKDVMKALKRQEEELKRLSQLAEVPQDDTNEGEYEEYLQHIDKMI